MKNQVPEKGACFSVSGCGISGYVLQVENGWRCLVCGMRVIGME